MPTEISLLDMPDVTMGNILEHCDYPSMQTLRKVCHSFRNFIDDTKPEIHLTQISFVVKQHFICFDLQIGGELKVHPDKNNRIYIKYQKDEIGCTVNWKKDGRKNEKLLENEDFVEVFRKDFGIIMKHQSAKSVIQEVSLIYSSWFDNKVMEAIKEALKSESRSHPIRTKVLIMEIANQNEIMSVVPFVSVEKITIFDNRRSDGRELKIDEIVELEQWKQVKELKIYWFFVSAPMKCFMHFSKIYIRMNTLTLEDVVLLKTLTSSPNLKSFEVFLEDNEAENHFFKAFGQPFIDTDQYNRSRKRWFFQTPEADKILSIHLYNDFFFVEKIGSLDVPHGALIGN